MRSVGFTRGLSAAVIAGALLTATQVSAAPFNFIRIGDLDGFGFPTTAGLFRATQPTTGTTPADTNGNGRLEVLEFLPDLNTNGVVATTAGDDFDNRSANEKADIGLSGNGFTDTGSTGAKWTDISLSTSFTGPDFPDGNPAATPNAPTFIYDFHVNGGDINPAATFFFNVLFGDYDVLPANITLSFFSSPSRTIALSTQIAAQDGLIQAAFATLTFGEVFTSDGAGGWDGFLRVDFVAPNEPYTSFDFTELSTTPINVPEPVTLALLGVGLVGGMARARRRAREIGC